MFTLFDLKKSVPLTAEELRHLLSALRRFAATDFGRWLAPLLEPSEPAFFWNEAMKDGPVMGCFTPLHPRAVFLKPHTQYTDAPEKHGRAFWCEMIFPTVVHELRHMWQFRRHPCRYVLCALPGLRQFTLERDAKAVEDDAQRFADNWRNTMDRAEFVAAYGRPPEGEEK